MKQAFNNTTSALSIPTEADQKIRRHEQLLHQIALYFGYSAPDSLELVQQVCYHTHQRYAKQDIGYPLKVFMVKLLVHRCIFKMSSQLFRQSTMDVMPFQFGSIAYHSLHTLPGGLHLHQIPLSFRAVYILNKIFQFNEIEIAEILNTTTLNVKERFTKALLFIKDQQND